MTKSAKIWLIIGVSLFIFGALIFTVIMTINDWDFSKLSTEKYETVTHKITLPFSEISIKTDTSDIEFFESKDGGCSVVCYERTREKHIVSVKDGGMLNITLQNDKKWYDNIGISFDSPKIKIYMPKGKYITLNIQSNTSDVEIPECFAFVKTDIALTTGDVEYSAHTRDLKIVTSTGDIDIENIKCETLDLKVSTGETHLENVEGRYIQSLGNTGDITLENTVAEKLLLIKRSTGDVRLERSDSATIYIKTDTGDVTGTVLEDRHFDVVTNTGDVRVPKEGNGGNCQIITNTGDIIIDIAK